MNVLIIEDDPMVAKLNEDFLSNLPSTHLIGSCRSTQDAWELIHSTSVDVILLDNYLPNQTGIEFLAELRQKHYQIPVVLITAANDIETIQQALALGAVDYLVKPFTAERFAIAIQKVFAQKQLLSQLDHVDQQNIDVLFNETTSQSPHTFSLDSELPKGLARLTMEKVLEKINAETTPFSTEELAKKIGISRISTKKYLAFLVETNYLSENIVYKDIGRPVTRYNRIEIK